jgi:NitT/TauT family transport system substrate-binding protein
MQKLDKLAIAIRKTAAFAACIIGLYVATVAFAGNVGDQPQAGVQLRVGLAGIEPGMGGLWMAKEAGFLAKEGLDVEFVFFSSGTEGVQALVAGDPAVMSVGGPPLINAMVAGADIVLIAELLGTTPYTLFAAPNIHAPSDLKGKRIGVSKFGSGADFAIRYALGKLGLNPTKDLTFLQLGEQAMRLAALRAGNIDATVFTPPETLIARRLGYRELMDMSRLGMKYPHEVLGVSRAFFREHPDRLRGLLKALVRGTQYFKTHPEDGIRCLGKYLQMEDTQALTETYKYISQLIPAKPLPSLEGIQMVLDQVDNPRSQQLKPMDFVDLRMVRELDESGFIDQLYRQ